MLWGLEGGRAGGRAGEGRGTPGDILVLTGYTTTDDNLKERTRMIHCVELGDDNIFTRLVGTGASQKH